MNMFLVTSRALKQSTHEYQKNKTWLKMSDILMKLYLEIDLVLRCFSNFERDLHRYVIVLFADKYSNISNIQNESLLHKTTIQEKMKISYTKK